MIQSSSHKYYFTELALISQLLADDINSCKVYPKMNLDSILMNEEGDISTLCITTQRQVPEASISIQVSVRIRIVQIQTSIKFHALFVRQQYGLDTHQQKALQQQFQYVDEFWINYRNYLPKKHYQSYHLSDLSGKPNAERLSKLKLIFTERIINQIEFLTTVSQQESEKQGSSTVKKDSKALVISAVTQNYVKLCAFLKPKDYKNLCICNRELYKVLSNQQNYKVLFEERWGRTGFDLDQKNWQLLYKNKILEESRKTKKKSYQGFHWND